MANKNTKIQGFFTALVLPFDDDLQVDIPALRQLIRFQIAAGADGVVFLATTGETPTLTAREKEMILQVGREETLNKIHFMVGTGSYSTAQTIENTRLAKEIGADSAMIVTPYYNRPTQQGIYLHFKAIAEAVDLPILVYNHQGRTGQNIQTDTLLRIAGIQGICGVKEASGNIAQIIEVIDYIGKKDPSFRIMSGDDLVNLPLMAMGGHGAISVVGNMIPIHMKALLTAAAEGRYDEAREIHYQMMPFFRMIGMETNPIPIKAAMHLSGMSVGRCRLPLCDLLPENQKKLSRLLEEPQIAKIVAENLALYKECGIQEAMV